MRKHLLVLIIIGDNFWKCARKQFAVFRRAES
jgi:hypothetical protein